MVKQHPSTRPGGHPIVTGVGEGTISTSSLVNHRGTPDPRRACHRGRLGFLRERPRGGGLFLLSEGSLFPKPDPRRGTEEAVVVIQSLIAEKSGLELAWRNWDHAGCRRCWAFDRALGFGIAEF